MSKIIQEKNGFYTKLNIYEKYFKMNHDERIKYFKFIFSLVIGLSTISIPLIIGFKTYWRCFLYIDIIIFILSIPFYFFLYKKPKNGIGIWRL